MFFLTKPFQIILASTLLVILATGLSKDFGEVRRIRDRGRLVASVVREQRMLMEEMIGQGSQIEDKLNQARGWPDDSLLLETYLISVASGRSDLKKVSSEFTRLTFQNNVSRHVSRQMAKSLERWNRDLANWAEMQSKGLPSIDALMSEGRRHSFESMGYRKIGRGYDAAVLDLWSVSLLSQFVEESPMDPRVPEALYLLANAYSGLRFALPNSVRGDRILNPCSELYPESIWSKQATKVWQAEKGTET